MSGFSFAPEDFTKGLLSDIRGKVVTAKCEVFKGNPTAKGFLALVLGLELENGKVEAQAWSFGGKAHESYQATSDGDSIEPKLGSGKSTVQINEKAPVAILSRELLNVGFPHDRLKQGKASAFIGTDAHWDRIKLEAFKDSVTGEDVQKDCLVPKRLYAAPGGVSAAPVAQPGVTSVPGAPTSQAADASVELAKSQVMGAIMRNNGRIAMADVPMAVFTALEGNPQRADVMRVITQASFLSGGPWKSDGSNLSF